MLPDPGLALEQKTSGIESMEALANQNDGASRRIILARHKGVRDPIVGFVPLDAESLVRTHWIIENSDVVATAHGTSTDAGRDHLTIVAVLEIVPAVAIAR